MDITRCKRDLDFKPLKRSNDSLPAVAWNGYLLTGFHRSSGSAINLHGPLPELLKDCYPTLSFIELSRFMERLENHPALFEEFKASTLAAYHFKDHPEMDELMGLVLALPFDYQNWLAEKSLAPRELYPLRVVFRQKPKLAGDFVSKTLAFLKEKKSSRSQIARAIELACDLFLMNREPFHPAATTEIWLRHLESARYPTTKRAQGGTQGRVHERVRQLPWPAHVQARWIDDGQGGGIEVTFHVHNGIEMQSTLEGLEHLSAQLEDQVWKNH